MLLIGEDPVFSEREVKILKESLGCSNTAALEAI